ncbi:MAG: arginine--tRNA ligase [Nitrosomonadaceae bacterium]|nr:arginine--tRNA ligase [Nitrosomonadaceae bacterium]|tara:strand:- start:803 stop:2560 length:1758 start_codon:yes stop_codon:yes gene_type:complete
MTPRKHTSFKSHFEDLLRHALCTFSTSDLNINIEFTRTKQASHGDYSCNLAMQLAKPLRRNPRDIAAILIKEMPPSPHLEKIEVAGNGFINIFLKTTSKQEFLHTVLQSGKEFGHRTIGNDKKVQVEFVSANPTGPLHVGHGRGAAFGASLSNILTAVGYAVSCEYYVNDAGRQMDILAASVWLRYLELNGEKIYFPSNAYQGEYIRNMAEAIYKKHKNYYVRKYHMPTPNISTKTNEEENSSEILLDQLISEAKNSLGEDYIYIHNFALTEQLADCRNDLMEFGVVFDTWFSEQSLHKNGEIAQAINLLRKKNLLYLKDGATWFRSTNFGDEKDRVVERENGQFTYFASDIAYHINKFKRGFERIINVWGADHHGYIPRVKGAIRALKLNPTKLEIALVQFAILYRDGIKIPMSTRSGEFITLRELRKEVGNDAARFFYLLRKSDQHLDFDLNLAKSQKNDNPVYYIQYAHARVCSVMKQWGEDPMLLATADACQLSNAVELSLLQKLIDYPEIVTTAARDLSPHLVAFYLRELAAEFHSYYNSSRFLVAEISVRHARLALIASIRQVLANGLNLLGVKAPDKM